MSASPFCLFLRGFDTPTDLEMFKFFIWKSSHFSFYCNKIQKKFEISTNKLIRVPLTFSNKNNEKISISLWKNIFSFLFFSFFDFRKKSLLVERKKFFFMLKEKKNKLLIRKHQQILWDWKVFLPLRLSDGFLKKVEERRKKKKNENYEPFKIIKRKRKFHKIFNYTILIFVRISRQKKKKFGKR